MLSSILKGYAAAIAGMPPKTTLNLKREIFSRVGLNVSPFFTWEKHDEIQFTTS